MKGKKARVGLLTKIIVFLAAVLIPLATVTWYVSVQTLRRQMTDEFTSKGSAIANSLASSGVDLILTLALAGATIGAHAAIEQYVKMRPIYRDRQR